MSEQPVNRDVPMISPTEHEPMMSGVIKGDILLEMLQHIGQSSYTGKMVVFGPDGSGLIYFQHGRLMHADNHVRRGDEALAFLLVFMHTGHYQFWEVPVDVEANIRRPQVLMWAAKIKDDCQNLRVASAQDFEAVLREDHQRTQEAKQSAAALPRNIPLHPPNPPISARWGQGSEVEPSAAPTTTPAPAITSPQAGVDASTGPDDFEYDDPPTAELLTTRERATPVQAEPERVLGRAPHQEGPSVIEPPLVDPQRLMRVRQIAIEAVGPMGRMLLLITAKELGLQREHDLPVVPVTRQIEFVAAFIEAMQLTGIDKLNFERRVYDCMTD